MDFSIILSAVALMSSSPAVAIPEGNYAVWESIPDSTFWREENGRIRKK